MMPPRSVIRNDAALLLASIVVLTLWRYLAMWDAELNLSVDEAQYFLWSLEPAWGYFSKPPLIAWVIAATSTVCGDSEACIRLPSPLLFAASTWVVMLIARRLFNPRISLASGLAFATLFLTSFYSWFMTTDSLLLFFWSLSLLFFIRAVETDRWLDWVLLGISAGLGLLAKYSFVFFLGSALLLLWLDHRKHLTNPKTWVAAILAFAILAPNLAWNYRHDFATVHHLAAKSHLGRDLIHPQALASFALSQFAVMGPLLFPALLLAFADKELWRSDPRHRLLMAFSIPPLFLYAILSLLSRAYANWAASAYVTATLLAASFLIRRGYRKWLTWAIIANVLLAGALYHWHRLAPALGVPTSPRLDPFHSLRNWDDAGSRLGRILQNRGCRTIVADDRSLIVELAYYARRSLGEPILALSYNPGGSIRHHFDLTADISQHPFDCAILIGNHDANRLSEEFETLETLAPLALPNGEQPLWRVGGFLGYGGAAGR